MKTPLLVTLLLVTLTVTGCDTFQRRSQERASTFASLAPAEQEKLRRGVIEVSNTPDMVYIALGRPDETHETSTAQGRETVWIYNSYHREYEGNIHTGYHRILIFDPVRKRYTVFYEPISTDVYSEHSDEHIRIKFKDDKVAVIEQPKTGLD
jgi:hypothetical protein